MLRRLLAPILMASFATACSSASDNAEDTSEGALERNGTTVLDSNVSQGRWVSDGSRAFYNKCEPSSGRTEGKCALHARPIDGSAPATKLADFSVAWLTVGADEIYGVKDEKVIAIAKIGGAQRTVVDALTKDDGNRIPTADLFVRLGNGKFLYGNDEGDGLKHTVYVVDAAPDAKLKPAFKLQTGYQRAPLVVADDKFVYAIETYATGDTIVRLPIDNLSDSAKETVFTPDGHATLRGMAMRDGAVVAAGFLALERPGRPDDVKDIVVGIRDGKATVTELAIARTGKLTSRHLCYDYEGSSEQKIHCVAPGNKQSFVPLNAKKVLNGVDSSGSRLIWRDGYELRTQTF